MKRLLLIITIFTTTNLCTVQTAPTLPQNTHAHEGQPSKLSLNMKILGVSALVQFGIMQKHEGKAVGAFVAAGSLASLLSLSLFEGWLEAEKEDGYSLLSARDRMQRIVYHTKLHLNSAKATDMIVQISGTNCLAACFFPHIKSFATGHWSA